MFRGNKADYYYYYYLLLLLLLLLLLSTCRCLCVFMCGTNDGHSQHQGHSDLESWQYHTYRCLCVERTTGTVNIEVTSAGSHRPEESQTRNRRSADLPPALDLSFTLAGRNISLGLHRNPAMDHRPPVYRVRGHGLERLLPGVSKVGGDRPDDSDARRV